MLAVPTLLAPLLAAGLLAAHLRPRPLEGDLEDPRVRFLDPLFGGVHHHHETVDEPEAGFRPVKSYYYYPLGGALALAGLLCIVSLLQSVALRRIGGVQTDAG